MTTAAGADDVEPAYADGILEVRVPIDEVAAGARRVPVKKR